jgi:hypothetical protein
MNIFYLDHDVVKCAEMHNDKHVVKMILEYAQLLSTAHRYLDGNLIDGYSKTGRKQKRYVLSSDIDSILYASTHINHPSAIWVRQSPENYIWLANMLVALCEEYTHRYGKIHKVERDGLCYVLFKNIPNNIGNSGFTQPTPAMPDKYKVKADSIQSYRNYYKGDKQHIANWKNRTQPSWYEIPNN